MGRAKRNPSWGFLDANDGFRYALSILLATHLRFRLNRDPQACLERRTPQERERIADVNRISDALFLHQSSTYPIGMLATVETINAIGLKFNLVLPSCDQCSSDHGINIR